MRRHGRLGLAGIALAAGCATAQPAGPPPSVLHRRTEYERWFSVPTRCGQGPYEIELATLGGRWYEEIELQVESRQRVRLTAVLLLDDQEVQRITDTRGSHHGEGRENQFCLAAPVDVAQAMSPGAAAAGAIAASRGPGEGGADPLSGAAATLLAAERPPNGGDSLIYWSAGKYGAPDVDRKGGQRVRIRFWSDLPNDFQGTRIGVRQMVTRPDSDQEYDAWLADRARWDREQAARLAARTPARLAADRKSADEAAAKQQQAQRAWRAHCQAQPDDWQCLSDSERAARNLKKSLRAPPPPRAEPAVPKPSQNAEWRAGYWTWAGSDWLWIAGMWRVPDEDIRAERTVHAPVAPPAPPAEATPLVTAPAAVWTPGFWQWSGSGWMWVAGSWQLPPTANLRWQPPRWVYRGGVFVFVPGGWVSASRP